MIIRAEAADPEWLVAVQNRQAILWLGPDLNNMFPDQPVREIARSLIVHPWAAVYVDGSDLDVSKILPEEERLGSLVLRHYVDVAGPDRLPPNRLPIFSLRGSSGSIQPGIAADPLGLLTRYQMVGKAPAVQYTFVVGVESEVGLAGILEAQRISSGLRRLVWVAPPDVDVSAAGDLADTVFHWSPTGQALVEFLEHATVRDGGDDVVIMAWTPSGQKQVNIGKSVDQSNPITRTFEFIPATDLFATATADVDLLRRFLADPTGSWGPYAAGVPYSREEQYERPLVRYLDAFRTEGAAASFTAWIPAEQGSGGTTALRQLLFNLARRGFPVMVAKKDADKFDFTQLSAFLTNVSARFSAEGVSPADLPWVVAFDAQHSEVQAEFIVGLANGLKKLLRSVVILAIRPTGFGATDPNRRALGTNRVLGDTLRNSMSSGEATTLGAHFTTFLPLGLRRTADEWKSFVQDTVRTSITGNSSLFWVALRFWLFHLPGAEQPIRQWLTAKFVAATDDDPHAYAGLMEVAALARYRLVTPVDLLEPESARAVRKVAWDTSNPLGVRIVTSEHTDALALAHPLVAEEILRIAQLEEAALSAIQKTTCFSLLDLELSLLERLIKRPAAASPECVEIIEKLVTTGLRVDPREAPRNYQVRERIVDMLESAPDALFDTSQLFSHHLARARRHVALDPPSPEWGIEARREQLALAENHLFDAIEFVLPEDDHRREKPVNLQVSLALTLDARARLEETAGDLSAEAQYRARAEQAYATAQFIDADNSYVLENYARFKIRQADKSTTSQDERVALLLDAITLLEWERKAIGTSERDATILGELGGAYEKLQQGTGRKILSDLAAAGNEAALLALSKLLIHEGDAYSSQESALADAEAMIRKVPSNAVTWRSSFALYQIVSVRRKFEFGERLEILQALAADPQFAWPLQLKLELGILLFQVGDPSSRRKGVDVFREIREEIASRSSGVTIPDEMRFLADPSSGFRNRMLTSVIVTNVSSSERNFFGIPRGWFKIDVPFRPYLFGGEIRKGDERDCFIVFSHFGPQAVPPTTE